MACTENGSAESISSFSSTTSEKRLQSALALEGGSLVSGKYRLSGLIDSGTSGVVWEATHTKSGSMVAIKFMKRRGSYTQSAQARAVWALLVEVSKPEYLSLFSGILDFGVRNDHQYLVYNRHPCTLGDLLRRHKQSPLLTWQKRGIMNQIMLAVLHLHSLNIVHTDLKPDNIAIVDDSMVPLSHIGNNGKLLTLAVLRNIQIKILDLDDSRKVTEICTGIIGSDGYTAPEVFCGIGWGLPADIFSMGCIIYELQYHQAFIPHFNDKEEAKELFFAYIEEALGPFKPCHAMEIHSYRKDIFDGNSSCPRVVVKDEDKREEVTRLVHDTETNLYSTTTPDEFRELVKGCLTLDPRRRYTAVSCYHSRFFRRTTS